MPSDLLVRAGTYRGVTATARWFAPDLLRLSGLARALSRLTRLALRGSARRLLVHPQHYGYIEMSVGLGDLAQHRTCGCPKLCAQPVTCPFVAASGQARSADDAAADLPGVHHAPGLDRAAQPIRHHQRHRDPGPAPPALRTPTTHPASASSVDRPGHHRHAHPTAPGPPTPRAPGHPGHHPALAPPADRPLLDDHEARPTRATRHPRRPPRPRHPTGY